MEINLKNLKFSLFHGKLFYKENNFIKKIRRIKSVCLCFKAMRLNWICNLIVVMHNGEPARNKSGWVVCNIKTAADMSIGFSN